MAEVATTGAMASLRQMQGLKDVPLLRQLAMFAGVAIADRLGSIRQTAGPAIGRHGYMAIVWLGSRWLQLEHTAASAVPFTQYRLLHDFGWEESGKNARQALKLQGGEHPVEVEHAGQTEHEQGGPYARHEVGLHADRIELDAAVPEVAHIELVTHGVHRRGDRLGDADAEAVTPPGYLGRHILSCIYIEYTPRRPRCRTASCRSRTARRLTPAGRGRRRC